MHATKRPKRGTGAIDKAIIKRLIFSDSGVEWKDLKKVFDDRDLSDSTLGQALKRLATEGMIIKLAEIREGKAVVIYTCREIPGGFGMSGGFYNSYLMWIQETLRKLLEEKGIEYPWRKGETDWGKDGGFRIPEKQSEALEIAVRWLAIIILGHLGIASRYENKEVGAKYLDTWCRLQLSVLIQEVTRLTCPELGGPVDFPIREARELLGTVELYDRIYLPHPPVLDISTAVKVPPWERT